MTRSGALLQWQPMFLHAMMHYGATGNSASDCLAVHVSLYDRNEHLLKPHTSGAGKDSGYVPVHGIFCCIS